MGRSASTLPGCTIADCPDPHEARGLCHRHYERARRNGTPGEAVFNRAPNGAGSITTQGYVTRYAPGHPLARAQHKILEHRLVLFAKIGYGPHLCHWCGMPIHWTDGPPTEDSIVTDHIDEDRQNNAPENLVPSCNACNVGRTS